MEGGIWDIKILPLSPMDKIFFTPKSLTAQGCLIYPSISAHFLSFGFSKEGYDNEKKIITYIKNSSQIDTIFKIEIQFSIFIRWICSKSYMKRQIELSTEILVLEKDKVCYRVASLFRSV